MSLDVESLLVPVSDDDPVGPDMSYDDNRLSIETAFETSFGEGGSADVNWPEITKLITAQCAQTKDIWLGVYLTRAGALGGKLDIVQAGAELLAGLFTRYWEHVHPQLDEYGLQGRIGPCESIARFAEFLRPLKNVVLVEHPRLGSYSAADFERFTSNGDSEDGYGMFRAAMADMPEEAIPEALLRIEALAAALQQIDAVFSVHAPGDGPNFETTYEAIAQIRTALRPYSAADDSDEASGESAEYSDGPSGAAETGGRLSGKVDSREDVIKAIDSICDYYRRREPGSPVMTVLGRVRGWVPMDFLAILEDIAPNSLDEAKKVLVSQKEEASYATYES